MSATAPKRPPFAAVPDDEPEAPPMVVLQTVADIIRGKAFKRPRRKFPTGIPDLDAATAGGLRSRQQSVLTAPTGVGKTGMAGTMMLGLSALHPVLWICTELDAEEQAARFAALMMRCNRSHSYTADELMCHELPPDDAACVVDGKPIYIKRLRRSDGDPFTVIRAYATTIQEKHSEPPLIVIDYLQKLAVEDEDRRRMSVANVSEQLLEIAQDIDTHMMAISSVSRAYYNATARKLRKQNEDEDPRDWLAAGKEAGEIEYDAALLMYLDVGDNADAIGQRAARLIVAKARGGGEGFYGLRFHGPSGLFVPDVGAANEMRANKAATETVNLDKLKSEIRRLIMKRKRPFTSRAQIAERLGGRTQDAYAAIDAMFEADELTQHGRGKPIELTAPDGDSEDS